MDKPTILIVEDGRSQRELLRGFLKDEGYEVAVAEDGEKGLNKLRGGHFDLILLDYKMPGMDGMTVLVEIKTANPEIDVIMMTAHGSVETAVNAMKAGAADYITKPVELEELLIQIDKICEHKTLIRENRMLRESLKDKGITADQIIYKSAAMEEMINLAGRVAGSDTTVLIQGESGTGKELIARLIHQLSPRSDKPMITVQCAALPESLLESELFGHEKGAYTGAVKRRIGRFEQADSGTLFLDEVGELSALVQVKLLRFLQEREFQRVGGNRTIRSDARVISASNQDLTGMVSKGKFREDLFYRLNVVTLAIPALRERKEDVGPLIDHFRQHYGKVNGKIIQGFSSEARDLLLKYAYPGNIRELKNIIERAVVITRGTHIATRDLPFQADAVQESRRPEFRLGPMKEAVERLERNLIEKALEQAKNNQSKAAGLLSISERMLRYKLKKYGLKQETLP